MKRAEAEARGRRAEARAAWWLRLKGWRIIARRVRTPVGEIDLVARRRRTLAFVEVKARATAAERDFAIDQYRLRRVAAAASVLESRYAKPGDTVQIDVVLIAPGHWPVHIANVWHG